MIFEDIYNRLLQIVIDNHYTPEQVRSATKNQAAKLLNEDEVAAYWTEGNIGFFINLRENIARELENTITRTDMKSAKEAVLAIFPNATFEIDRRHRVAIVYLDGDDDGVVK